MVGILLLILNHSLEQNFLDYKTSKSNVECGFESNSKLKIEFSNQFFIITIIFLIFEIEIIILIPLPVRSIRTIIKLIILNIMILILLRLLLEWINSMLEWSNSQIKLY